MPELSAEFLRGAKWMAQVLGESGEEERVDVLLVQAEAREARAKSRGQLCTCQSHQFVACRGQETLGKGWVCRRQQEQDGKAREASKPDAADVINELREALEEIDDYRGGADSVLEDKYVTERRRDALALADQYTPEVIPGTRDALARLTIKAAPDAAAVIAQCKTALELNACDNANCQASDCKAAHDALAALAALATTAAWEAGR